MTRAREASHPKGDSEVRGSKLAILVAGTALVAAACGAADIIFEDLAYTDEPERDALLSIRIQRVQPDGAALLLAPNEE